MAFCSDGWAQSDVTVIQPMIDRHDLLEEKVSHVQKAEVALEVRRASAAASVSLHWTVWRCLLQHRCWVLRWFDDMHKLAWRFLQFPREKVTWNERSTQLCMHNQLPITIHDTLIAWKTDYIMSQKGFPAFQCTVNFFFHLSISRICCCKSFMTWK